jgi:hypothetical protein
MNTEWLRRLQGLRKVTPPPLMEGSTHTQLARTWLATTSRLGDCWQHKRACTATQTAATEGEPLFKMLGTDMWFRPVSVLCMSSSQTATDGCGTHCMGAGSCTNMKTRAEGLLSGGRYRYILHWHSVDGAPVDA